MAATAVNISFAKKAHKVGRLWKFQASEVDDWVRRNGASASTRDEDAE